MRTLKAALAVGAFVSTSGDALAGMALENPWSEKHIKGLPSEIQRNIAKIAERCGGPFAAQHLFSTYYRRGETQLIALHFENTNCQVRSTVCKNSGCLHQVYASTGGPFRLLRSTYEEVDIANFRVPRR